MENLSLEQIDHIKGVIESLLFVNEKSVPLEQITKVLETVESKEVKKIIHLLMDEYAQMKRGMTIVEIAGGYQMLSNALYASYIRSFYKTKHKEKLSKPSLETAAIIAYKQPVTRGDIELIRGVNSDGVVANLLKKELIKIVGRRDIAGRPYVYGTTRQFLEYFGLKSLSNLPKLQEEFPKLKTMDDPVIGASEENMGDEVTRSGENEGAEESRKENLVETTKAEADHEGEPLKSLENAESGIKQIGA